MALFKHNIKVRAATISPCGQYRYGLRRFWDLNAPKLCYIMLNPSTADAEKDDATIRVCMGRAERMGYGGIYVVNLFALRSTNPEMLYDTAYPISEPSLWFKNDAYINVAVLASNQVICAWGSHGKLYKRDQQVLMRLRSNGIMPYAIRLNKDGTPAHPLRIGYDQQPFSF